MYPFKEGELRGLLHEAGFDTIRVYGDYEPLDQRVHKRPPEFFTYVCKKSD
jgi:hypothetical protein